jgi:hypothetical protein
MVSRSLSVLYFELTLVMRLNSPPAPSILSHVTVIIEIMESLSLAPRCFGRARVVDISAHVSSGLMRPVTSPVEG